MFSEVYKTEREFKDNCRCAYSVLNFVENIEDTDVKWFFYNAYYHDYPENSYSVIFKSYVTEEYRDYILSVGAKFNKETGKYDVRLVRKVDKLMN
ncbi:hypothetical protein D1872_242400 [compost metagenome]